MAAPTKPQLDYSYVSFQQELGDNSFPGSQLQADLDELVRASSDTIDALADVRRSDGALKNQIVTPDSLSPATRALMAGVGATGPTGASGPTNIDQNSKSAAYTLVLGDAAKHILHPASDNNARTFTIPANASVAFPVGTVVTFVNEINTVTIAITTDTLTLAGAGTTGSRSLAANGIATALKITSTKWVISGTGLT